MLWHRMKTGIDKNAGLHDKRLQYKQKYFFSVPPHFLLLGLALALAGSVLLLTSGKAQAQNAPAKPGQVLQLESLSMINQRTGWALENNRTRVFFTQAGPTHWRDVTPAGLNLPGNDEGNSITAFTALDASHGYLGVLQNGQTSFLSTRDSGKSWQKVDFDFSPLTFVGIYQIDFLDARHGWLAFDKDHGFGRYEIVLMSTSDGGKTWQQLLDTTQGPGSGLPELSPKFFHFTSVQQGWVTGDDDNTGNVRLYVTNDGGKTWTMPTIPPLGATYTESSGPSFRGNYGTLPVLYGTQNGAIMNLSVYHTSDGGKNWNAGPVISTTTFTELRTIFFRNANEGWILGKDANGQAILRQTWDGGKHWQIIHPTGLTQFTEVILDLKFLTPTTGWTTNKNDKGLITLFQTNDGGRSWKALEPTLEQ